MEPISASSDSLEALLAGPDPSVLRLGLLVPLSGPLGLTGPSALDAAALATQEVNAAGGVNGRRVELVVVDAGSSPAQTAHQARCLAGACVVDAFVGLHTSDVHRAVERALAGATPYIFTPPHEGGSRLPGVVLLGDSPAQQLGAAVAWLSRQRRLRRWALLGSDYIWTWAVHSTARPLLRRLGAEIAWERLVPFGLQDGPDSGELVDSLSKSNVDAVLLSLIGRDQAMFNRAFASSRLGSRIVRVSGALEENGLLAAGGDETGELYAAMRSFAGQQEDRRIALAERFTNAFGERAPVLDAYSEGCYDGVHLTVALAALGALTAPAARSGAARLFGDRESAVVRQAWSRSPLGAPRRGGYLARAEGLELAVVAAV